MNDLLFDDSLLPPDHRSGFVAVLGRPNVGKSTLMNHYLGQKIAIVSPKAQTTRNRLLGILTRDEAQVIFVDTPGIHQPHHKFGEYMVEVALSAIPDADLILWLVDGSVPPTPEDRLVAGAIQDNPDPPPFILAMNKIDLLPPEAVSPRLEEYLSLLEQSPALAMPLSATRGDHRDDLLQAIIALLPPG
ncbi:MAG: GTPase Era, partial [Caldilineae bacterium]